MMHFALAAVVFLCSATPELPDYLQSFQATWGKEAELTEGLRGFDRDLSEQIDRLIKEAHSPTAGAPVLTPEQASARAAELAGKIRKAYELALETYPRNARLHNYYGEVLYDRFGDAASGLKEWNLALQNDDKLAAAYNNLALHHFNFGEYEQGLKMLDLALKYDKDNPDYLYNESNIYMVNYPQIAKLRKWEESKVYKEAMKASKKATKLSPDDYDLLQDYALNFFEAEKFKQKTEWNEAAAAWQQARAKSRNDDERFYCWLNEGRVWTRAGDKEKAKTCFDEALKIHPDSAPAQDLLNALQAPKS